MPIALMVENKQTERADALKKNTTNIRRRTLFHTREPCAFYAATLLVE